MIWTGVLLMAFIIYHLAHFTFQIIYPESAALKNMVPGLENQVVPNVLGMVVSSFQSIGVTLIYAGAMLILFLHLSHGIQSFFQTMGWSNDRTQPFITKAGTLAALAMFAGYVIIPIFILVRILK
jgi:succinate dehydrogenase / fumarate reductase cytochrome b subunit